jgi:hypothetical protein
MALEKIDIRNRWTNEVQVTAEIDCSPDATARVKLGLAVRWAVKTGANLAGANLTDADLTGADLRDAVLRGAVLRDADLAGANLAGAYLAGANLAGANLAGAYLAGAYLTDADLTGANLRGANLTDAYLRSIKADFWMILAMARHEVPALISALRNGKVDGSTYKGSCTCLVGTLENAGAKSIPHVPSSPAERWFSPIRRGDVPAGDGEGSFRARTALEWALEFCTVGGIDPDGVPTAQAEAA